MYFRKIEIKVAGVCETGREGNLLDLHVRVSQQQFLGFVDPVAGQIFIDRNTQEFAEQSGEILRSDKKPGCSIPEQSVPQNNLVSISRTVGATYL